MEVERATVTHTELQKIVREVTHLMSAVLFSQKERREKGKGKREEAQRVNETQRGRATEQ